jgi:hypothetical protein
MVDRLVYRPAVLRFVRDMLYKLYVHRAKGHWANEDNWWLYDRIGQEYAELQEALLAYVEDPTPENAKAVRYEAADIANIAMMVSDNVRGNR